MFEVKLLEDRNKSIALLPRALAKMQQPKDSDGGSGGGGGGEGGEQPAKKSNEDFHRMLMKPSE